MAGVFKNARSTYWTLILRDDKFYEKITRRYNKQTEKLLELAESKSFLNLDFNSEVARHVSMVKRLRKRVEVRIAHVFSDSKLMRSI